VLFTLGSVGSGFSVFGTVTRCAVQGEILRRRANCKSTFDAVLTCVDDGIVFFWGGEGNFWLPVDRVVRPNIDQPSAHYSTVHTSWYMLCVCVSVLHVEHTHTYLMALFPGLRVSRYQKSKTNLDFTEARDSEW